MTRILASNATREVLLEIGARLRGYRLQQNLTVVEVARRSGLNKNTILNAERGRNPRLDTVVSLLRVYGRLEALESFLPEPTISPLQVVRDKGRVRQRARSRRRG
jgi:transcriptional regulator with XRE-family HTH domain